jgi:hypothetical protein
MSEPSRGESQVPQSMQPARHAAPKGNARLQRRSVIVTSGTTAAALFVAGVFSPSYPHPWCEPMLAQPHAKQTGAQIIAGIGHIASQYPSSPAEQLVQGRENFDAAGATDQAAEQDADNFQILGDLSAAMQVTRTALDDEQQAERSCGIRTGG